jgi:hypothetical protein
MGEVTDSKLSFRKTLGLLSSPNVPVAETALFEVGPEHFKWDFQGASDRLHSRPYPANGAPGVSAKLLSFFFYDYSTGYQFDPMGRGRVVGWAFWSLSVDIFSPRLIIFSSVSSR